MSVHIVLAGGGTAGHVEPALATADALLRIDPGIDVTFLGTSSGLEARLVPARGYRLVLIPRVPLPRRPSVDLLAVPFRLRGAVRAVKDVLTDTRASVVVGFGGYVAMPAYLAARSARVACVVHEANARPGLANRVGARLTSFVAVGYPQTPLPHAQHLGTPLRPAIAALDRATSRVDAAQQLGLDPHLPTLLVFGGSQGASSINAAAAGAAQAFETAGVQVLHAAGPMHADALAHQVGRRDPVYRVEPYLDRMDLAYAVADLAVCRAGAMTCTELAAVGLPAVYIPLAHGNGEQSLNALPVVTAGGGVLLDDAGLTADRLAGVVLPILSRPETLARMSTAASVFGRRDGDVALARLVLAAAGGRQ